MEIKEIRSIKVHRNTQNMLWSRKDFPPSAHGEFSLQKLFVKLVFITQVKIRFIMLKTVKTTSLQKLFCYAGKYCFDNSVFIGERDTVRCFHCDGSLCNWEHAHDPFTEHARWYPNCAFIRSIKLGKGENNYRKLKRNNK